MKQENGILQPFTPHASPRPLRTVWLIAKKDIIDAAKNQYLFISLLMPVFLSLLFRVMFPGIDDRLSLTVAYYDAGASRIVSELSSLPDVQLVAAASEQEVQQAVRDKATGGLVIPPGFDAAVQAGEKPGLKVYLNNRQGGGALSAFQSLVDEQLWKLTGRDLPLADITILQAFPERAGLAAEGFRMDRFTLVMLLVLAISGVGVFIVPTLLVEEKERKTLKSLLVSPATPVEVAAGKALAGVVYSLAVVAVVMVLNRGWLGVWPVTLLAILLGTILMVLVGLVMGGLLGSIAQVNTWSSILLVALLLPSWFTVVPLPAPADAVVRLIPSFYLVDLLDRAASGAAPLSAIWVSLVVLAACAAAAFALVVWTLRRQERA